MIGLDYHDTDISSPLFVFVYSNWNLRVHIVIVITIGIRLTKRGLFYLK